MSVAQVIANYEALAALTGQMREAALRGEWDPLVDIERQRGELVAAMQSLDAEVRLDKAASRRKAQLINEVLAHDAEIRTLVEAWMSELELSRQSNLQELRLLREYGR
jgi:flagellar protein FliT